MMNAEHSRRGVVRQPTVAESDADADSSGLGFESDLTVFSAVLAEPHSGAGIADSIPTDSPGSDDRRRFVSRLDSSSELGMERD